MDADKHRIIWQEDDTAGVRCRDHPDSVHPCFTITERDEPQPCPVCGTPLLLRVTAKLIEYGR